MEGDLKPKLSVKFIALLGGIAITILGALFERGDEQGYATGTVRSPGTTPTTTNGQTVGVTPASLEQRVEALESEVAPLRGQNSLLLRRTAMLESQVTTLQSQLVQAKSMADDAHLRLVNFTNAGLPSGFTSLQGQVSNLSNQVAQATQASSAQASALSNIQSSLTYIINQQNTDFNALQGRLTDVQHRRAITCYLVAAVYGNTTVPSNDDHIKMCNGSFWNQGLVSGWLNSMIPFRY